MQSGPRRPSGLRAWFLRRQFFARLAAADRLADQDPERARQAYTEVVERAAQLWGPDSLVTLTAREDLAMTYLETPEVALQDLQALLPAFERVGGRDEPRTLDLRANIAVAAGVSGDHARAQELLGGLLSDCERLLGPEDARTLKVRENFQHAAEMASRAADTQ